MGGRRGRRTLRTSPQADLAVEASTHAGKRAAQVMRAMLPE